MSMSPDPSHQAQLQAQAEGPADTATVSDVDRYRYVYHAIRLAPLPSPPPDFAQRIERLTQDHEEQALPEVWLLRIVLAVVAAGVGLFVLSRTPAFIEALWASATLPGALPWQLLLAAAVGLGLAAAIDQLLGGSRRGSRDRRLRGG